VLDLTFGIILCYSLSVDVCFCCARFSFFSTMPRDWLGRTYLKWPILCQVGRKTVTESITCHQMFIGSLPNHSTSI